MPTNLPGRRQEHGLDYVDRPHYHFLDICGAAMGPLALDMARRGMSVSGSDTQWLPPIGPLLQASGIRLLDRMEIAAIADKVDVWVAGALALCEENVRRVCKASGAPIVSYPQLVRKELKKADKRVVVAGTKGKTTTSAMLSHILMKNGIEHDWLVGGTLADGRPSVKLDGSPLAVIEGDEYPDNAQDGRPKFFHYEPTHVIITSLAEDHIEQFPDFEGYCEQFRKLVAMLPPEGLCLLGGQSADPGLGIARDAVCRVANGGVGEMESMSKKGLEASGGVLRFGIGDVRFEIPCFHLANACNAVLAALMGKELGVSLEASAVALMDFCPPLDRLELRAVHSGRRVFVESCAHPLALKISLKSLSAHFPGVPIAVVVQPQYPGGREDHVQRDLPGALVGAERVVIAPTVTFENEKVVDPFLPELLAEQLSKLGVSTSLQNTRRGIINALLENSGPEHIILVAVHHPSREILTGEIISRLMGAAADK